jgi:two-component system, LuxR family, sensor kinase FixL
MLRQPLSRTITPRTGRSPAARLRFDNHHTPLPDDGLQSTPLPDDGLQSAAPAFEQLFVLSRDALVVEDIASGRITRWNPAAERLFGYSVAVAIGRPVDALMTSAVARLHRERVEYYGRTGDAHVLVGRAPLPILAITSSGENLRVEYSMAPLEVPGSRTRHLLLTFRDAQRQEQEEWPRSAATRAESARRQADARLHRFATLVGNSHAELQELAARARRTTARLARLAASERPVRLAPLAQIADCRVARLQRALEDASQAAAIQAGAFTLETQRVNLVPLVGKVVAAVRASAPAHKVKLSMPQGLTAQVDPQRIERVIQDVIERAIRRNPRGCWVDVDLTRPLAGAARLEVRDYGRPLSTREHERLVNPAANDHAWRLNCFVVEQHGGTMSLEWPAEGGVRVIIRLPTHRTRNTDRPSGERR